VHLLRELRGPVLATPDSFRAPSSDSLRLAQHAGVDAGEAPTCSAWLLDWATAETAGRSATPAAVRRRSTVSRRVRQKAGGCPGAGRQPSGSANRGGRKRKRPPVALNVTAASIPIGLPASSRLFQFFRRQEKIGGLIDFQRFRK
jgi:hypothetical protein